jgi:FMN phosphatase YigB (HAD superfamily)
MVTSPETISRELVDLLRPPLTDILANLGDLPNLRREWDSPEVLTVACLLNEASARQDLFDLAGAIRKLDTSEEDISLRGRAKSYQFALRLREGLAGVRFREALSRVKDRWGHFFPEHVQVFREYVTANAKLADGARDLISELMDLDVEIHVVSEGDSAIQMFKFYSLGLEELVQTCVVTDVTCGVTPILNELFILYGESGAIPEEILQLYDELAPYTVKSPAFFSKLLHALADSSDGGLQDRVRSTRFLTKDEWQSISAFRVVMIGDRYRKDLEPLLRVSSSGIKAYRVLTGRYYREDPLHEILDQRRPLPHGIFPDLQELRFLSTAISAPSEPVNRPTPVLPDGIVVGQVLKSCQDLSEASRGALLKLQSEALRHQGNE